MRKMLLIGLCSPLLISCSLIENGSITNLAGDIASVKNIPSTPSIKDVDPTLAIGAGKDLFDAATISDEDVSKAASEFAKHSDTANKIASSSSSYSKRLARLTQKHFKEDGLDLNFKVYLSPEVNAFALGNGTVRVYSGLMDVMTDDELLGVIGHEIGHVKLGHSHDKMRSSLLISAARKGVASSNTVAGTLAANSVGALTEDFFNAQYSQGKESDSDEYGLNFLLKHGYNPQGAIGAMEKLAKLEDDAGGNSKEVKLLSSHPAPGRRAEELAKILQSKGGHVQTTQKAKTATSPAKAEQSAKTHSAKNEVPQSSSQSYSDDFSHGETKSATLENSVSSQTARRKASTFELASIPSGYYLQTSAEEEAAEAARKAESLRQSGFNVQLQNAVVDGVRYKRVLVGPFSNRYEAETQKSDALNSGSAEFDSFVRRVN